MSTKPGQHSHWEGKVNTSPCLFNFNVSTVMEVSAGKDIWVPLAWSPLSSRIVANTS